MKDPIRAEHRFSSQRKSRHSRRSSHVRIGLLFALLATIAGCDGESPTAPRVPPQATPTPEAPSSSGHFFGTVYSAEGCVVGARIEILDGPAAGKSVEQSLDDCLGNDGSSNSYWLRDVPLGPAVRLRASRQGFQSQEKSVEPRSVTTIASDFSVDFELVKSP